MLIPLVLLPRPQTAVNGITAPLPGETVAGVVEVRGTAVHPDYLRYELAFLYLDSGAGDWIVFADGDQPVVQGVLAIWDTTVGQNIGAPVFPDGRYQLRLRVVKTDYNYDEYFVTDIVVSNAGPTPTPTPDETGVAATQTAVSAPATPFSSSDSSFQQATPLPSLTPFPTLTPRATPAANAATPAAAVGSSSGGVVGQLSQADWSRLSSGFATGVRITAVLFLIGILYLLLRAVSRRGWRWFWHRRREEE